MSAVATEEQQWTLVKSAVSLPRPIGTACAIFGLIPLAGYLGNLEPLYRPIAGGPATHPLTALCILLLGLAIRADKQTAAGAWSGRILTIMAISVSVFRIAEAELGMDMTALITPFYAKVQAELLAGKNNGMGVNTAIMMLSIAIALSFHNFAWHRISQFVAYIAVGIPTISFTGYAYGLERFYGQMSLLTASAGFFLAMATLLLTSNHGGLRAILSPHIGGRIARMEVLAGYLVPTGLGFVLHSSMVAGPNQGFSLFGMFVVAICWFIMMMVGISAIYQEEADLARRQSEVKLANAALTDSLTGIPNRRMFFESGRHEIERIKRSGEELWLLMLDIDHFKNINDTAGHAVGDKVLVAIADLLSQSIRKVDLAGRLGGEEFAVLVTGTNREGFERIAESIRRNIESLAIAEWTDIHGPVTVSIGCTRITGADSLERALSMADEALYQAKGRGRNQVITNSRTSELSLFAAD